MRTARLRFFMLPDEARARVLVEWPSSGDAIYFQQTPTALAELTSVGDFGTALEREWQFFVGPGGMAGQSLLETEPGLVSLNLPSIQDDTLVMAEIGVKWNPELEERLGHHARFVRWRAVFRKGLRGPTRWRFLGFRDKPPGESPSTELFSEGALAFHRAGGRWVQRWIPNQEWDPATGTRKRR